MDRLIGTSEHRDPHRDLPWKIGLSDPFWTTKRGVMGIPPNFSMGFFMWVKQCQKPSPELNQHKSITINIYIYRWYGTLPLNGWFMIGLATLFHETSIDLYTDANVPMVNLSTSNSWAVNCDHHPYLCLLLKSPYFWMSVYYINVCHTHPFNVACNLLLSLCFFGAYIPINFVACLVLPLLDDIPPWYPTSCYPAMLRVLNVMRMNDPIKEALTEHDPPILDPKRFGDEATAGCKPWLI